jgi:hypothetical protein
MKVANHKPDKSTPKEKKLLSTSLVNDPEISSSGVEMHVSTIAESPSALSAGTLNSNKALKARYRRRSRRVVKVTNLHEFILITVHNFTLVGFNLLNVLI